MAIATLAGIAGEAKCKASDRIYAAVALLDRGYGKPVTDGESREHLNITIRKILEIGAPPAPHTNGKVIEHEPTNGSRKPDEADG